MEPLITPAQVAGSAFRAPDFITPEAIPEATILAVQQKYLKPVLGEALYDRLSAGGYESFVADYLAAPLAIYVKMAMLPQLSVQAGAAGIVEVTSKNLVRANEAKLRAAIRRLRADASVLMRRAVEHIEAFPGLYPEYDRSENILNRCSVEGGIVLNKSKVKS